MKRIIYVCFIAMLLSSCTTSDNNQDLDSNFYALTVGNQWHYRWYSVNNEGVESPRDVQESISIVGTEEINGSIYYRFNRIISGNENGNYLFAPENGEHFEYYRDSLGYLVNQDGYIKFSNNSDEPFFIGSIDISEFEVTMLGELQSENLFYSTEAGSFDCLEVIATYTREDGYIYLATNNSYYSDGIGLIKDEQVLLASENAGYLRKLISYNVQ
ncbi:hypothetical protein [Winogradskyella psychrotolerans]|uniref:hypothetical protein n=1 Tax=Winogradskyella psychrotolerans TaxID=1344585 RepID=UPI001C06E714|nr:hypothetical protein [Winogradskyella psychrotolerans]MBU2928744.1 hypothetical protein [Winogradskyella psychrotolerans]